MFSVCFGFPPQDAHELFHVLTSSLEEERDRQPKVTNFFDMQSLEASYHSCLFLPKIMSKYLFHAWIFSILQKKKCSLEGSLWTSLIQTLPPTYFQITLYDLLLLKYQK